MPRERRPHCRGQRPEEPQLDAAPGSQCQEPHWPQAPLRSLGQAALAGLGDQAASFVPLCWAAKGQKLCSRLASRCCWRRLPGALLPVRGREDAGLLHNRPKNNPRAGSSGEMGALPPGTPRAGVGVGPAAYRSRFCLGPGPARGQRSTQRCPPQHLGDWSAESCSCPPRLAPGAGLQVGVAGQTPEGPGPSVPSDPGGQRSRLGLQWPESRRPQELDFQWA